MHAFVKGGFGQRGEDVVPRHTYKNVFRMRLNLSFFYGVWDMFVDAHLDGFLFMRSWAASSPALSCIVLSSTILHVGDRLKKALNLYTDVLVSKLKNAYVLSGLIFLEGSNMDVYGRRGCSVYDLWLEIHGIRMGEPSFNCFMRIGKGRPRKYYVDLIGVILKKAKKHSKPTSLCMKRLIDVSEAKEVCKGRTMWRKFAALGTGPDCPYCKSTIAYDESSFGMGGRRSPALRHTLSGGNLLREFHPRPLRAFNCLAQNWDLNKKGCGYFLVKFPAILNYENCANINT
ncbi:hypothetical protein EVAR_8283_1 [Eumeta japonica]|uniref:Uncharacterized protein n=1 Tax=Eumeta variegata TaxID=151549 RepID=A0A4C1YAY3_EUMVA|nr:hypothetical protein EVAR_8283_1 [Eumeta japonica]